MNSLLQKIGIAAMLIAALLVNNALAQHSDVEFEYDGGVIVVEPTAESGFVFESDFMEEDPNNETDEPGFGSETDEGLGIDPNDLVGYNVLDNLFFWDGSQFTSPGAASITIEHLVPAIPDTTVDGSSGVQSSNLVGPGFANVIGQADNTGDFHTHVDFILSPGAPTGAYGLLLSLSTDASGIGDSAPFGILFNNGLGEEDFESGVDAFGAFVPEPTSLALFVAAAGAFVFARRRRKE